MSFSVISSWLRSRTKDRGLLPLEGLELCYVQSKLACVNLALEINVLFINRLSHIPTNLYDGKEKVSHS